MPSQILSRETISFSFIATGITQSGDVIDGVIPIFTPILSQMAESSSVFVPQDFASTFTKSYGLPMTPLVAQSLAPKMVNAGFLVPRTGHPDSFVICTSSISSQEMNNIGVGELQKQFDELLDEFCLYVRQYAAEENIPPKSQDIKDGFRKRILTLDFLNAMSSSWKMPQDAPLDMTDIETSMDTTAHTSVCEFYLDVLSASFIWSLRDESPQKFQILESLVKGTLISEVVFTLVQRPDSAQLLRNVSVIIDGPLLLDALGLSTTRTFVTYARNLFEMMGHSNVQICAFKHSLTEIDRILHAALYDKNRVGNSRPELRARISREPTVVAKAWRVYRNIEANVRDLGVKIIDANDVNTAEFHCYCPSEVESTLVADLGVGASQRGILAREADATSVVATLRLREGQEPSSMVDAGYFFVTGSKALAHRANRHLRGKWAGRKSRLINKTGIPPVVTDRELAGYLWFSTGMPIDKIAKVAKNKIIAQCSAVLEPGGDIVSKVRGILQDSDQEGLVQEFDAIMGSERARHCLMLGTMGGKATITHDNAFELLEKMRQSMVADAITEAVSAEKTKHRVEQEKWEQDKTASDTERDTLRKSAKHRQTQVTQLEKKVEKAAQEIKTIAQERDSLKGKILEGEERLWKNFHDAVRKIPNECHARTAKNIGIIAGLLVGAPLLFLADIGKIVGPGVGLISGLVVWQVVARAQWAKRVLFQRIVEKMARKRILDMASPLGIQKDDFRIDESGDIQIVRKSPLVQ